MKPVLNALTLVMVGVGLSGCGYLFGDDGYFRDRGSDYQNATVAPRMTVPAELQSKPTGDLLPVPGNISAGNNGKFELPRPQGLNVDTGITDFSLQQNGGERWLLAQHGPANIWPLARQFFTEYQVPVARESATLGEIETDWLVFEQGSNNALIRRLLPAAEVSGRRSSDQEQRLMDRPADVLPGTSERGLQDTGVRANGQEQRFRLRIEPGVQAGTSEIKVLHMQRSARSDWPASSDNANLERALLAELESFLNEGGGLDSAALSTVGEAPAASRSSMGQDGAGNPMLSINSDFNRAWAAVGQALAKADILVDDLNRTSGVYYVNPQQSAEQDKPGFFGRLFRRDNAEQSQLERTQIRLTPVGNRVQVTVEDGINTSSDSSEARALLSRIHENLN